ncbi:MAG: NifB/NifX family molybdenum-iron cluster-binding protein [Dehalococcoidales bacterium]|nr:NifB/NifX family molybdenum-iron cluster-binding protein [Dehalococcoidales bacterium]
MMEMFEELESEIMAEAIQDCQVLLAGSMGWGAYEAMRSYGIEPVVTDVRNIYETVLLYLKGKLPNLMERLH